MACQTCETSQSAGFTVSSRLSWSGTWWRVRHKFLKNPGAQSTFARRTFSASDVHLSSMDSNHQFISMILHGVPDISTSHYPTTPLLRYPATPLSRYPDIPISRYPNSFSYCSFILTNSAIVLALLLATLPTNLSGETTDQLRYIMQSLLVLISVISTISLLLLPKVSDELVW